MTDLKDSKAKPPVRYMDFVSHKPRANADPLASRPASRPVVKPAPMPKKVHSVADQIPPKHETAPALKPEPAIRIKKSEQKPYISRTPASSRDLYADAIDPSKPKPTKLTSKPTDDLALKASAALSGASRPALKSPDNNAYSLSGKSPFLPNYTIDKRPLSNSVPAKKRDASYEKLSFLGVGDQPESSHKKNLYTRKTDAKKTKKEPKPPVRIIDDTEKKRGVPVWLVIIITILLGAGVGAGVYFLLPK